MARSLQIDILANQQININGSVRLLENIDKSHTYDNIRAMHHGVYLDR